MYTHTHDNALWQVGQAHWAQPSRMLKPTWHDTHLYVGGWITLYSLLRLAHLWFCTGLTIFTTQYSPTHTLGQLRPIKQTTRHGHIQPPKATSDWRLHPYIQHGDTLHCIGTDTCTYLLETEHLITMRLLYVQD